MPFFFFFFFAKRGFALEQTVSKSGP